MDTPNKPPETLDYAEPSTPPAALPLGQNAVRGVMWAASVTVLNRVISIAAQLVIAAVLLPAEFGIYAKALFISGILSQLLSPAVDQFLISRSKEFTRFAASAFWLSAGCGVLSLLLHIAAAPVVVAVQRNASLQYVLPLMGLTSLLAVCSTSLVARLSIELRFRKIAAIGLVSGFAAQALTVAAALAGWGVYALVVPSIITNAAVLVYLLVALPVPQLWRPHASLWPVIVKSSTQLMGVRVMQSAVAQGDYFILGLFATDAVVGIYYFAFNLAEQVARLLGVSVANVLTPSLAQINDDPPRARAAVLKASHLLCLAVTPMGIGQILFASTVVYALFGAKWMAAVPLIQIMSAAAIINVPAWPTGSMLSAAGRFTELLWIWVFNIATFAVCVTTGAWIGSTYSPAGAAVGVSIGMALYVVLGTACSVIVTLRDRATIGRMVSMLARSIAACIPAAAVIFIVVRSHRDGTRLEALIFSAWAGLLFLVLYLFMLRLIDPLGLRELAQRLGLDRFRPSSA